MRKLKNILLGFTFLFCTLTILLAIFVIHKSNQNSDCKIFANSKEYKIMKDRLESTWDKKLIKKIYVYEKSCLKDENATKNTIKIFQKIKNKESEYKHTFLEQIVENENLSKTALIKARYMISKYAKTNIESEFYLNKSANMLIFECDEDCLDEIFKTHANLLFDEAVYPCEIALKNLELQSKNENANEDILFAHKEFIDKYCKK